MRKSKTLTSSITAQRGPHDHAQQNDDLHLPVTIWAAEHPLRLESFACLVLRLHPKCLGIERRNVGTNTCYCHPVRRPGSGSQSRFKTSHWMECLGRTSTGFFPARSRRLASRRSNRGKVIRRSGLTITISSESKSRGMPPVSVISASLLSCELGPYIPNHRWREQIEAADSSTSCILDRATKGNGNGPLFVCPSTHV